MAMITHVSSRGLQHPNSRTLNTRVLSSRWHLGRHRW